MHITLDNRCSESGCQCRRDGCNEAWVAQTEHSSHACISSLAPLGSSMFHHFCLNYGLLGYQLTSKTVPFIQMWRKIIIDHCVTLGLAFTLIIYLHLRLLLFPLGCQGGKDGNNKNNNKTHTYNLLVCNVFGFLLLYIKRGIS